MNKILLILHKSTTNPGPVAEILQTRGYQIESRIPREGDPLPLTMDDYEAAISFGGAMSANDGEKLPFIRAELDWISTTVLSSNKPFLGICLGSQLLARALGGTVARHPQGEVEIGYHCLTPTLTGRKYFNSPYYFYHWNSEGFEMPSGAVRLASGEIFENQAFRYGDNAIGVQFHPEMVQSTLERWQKTEAQVKLPQGHSWSEQIQDHIKYAPHVKNWLSDFFSCWLGARTQYQVQKSSHYPTSISS
jgi:GMP synthase (glutamine-hydrolysing)